MERSHDQFRAGNAETEVRGQDHEPKPEVTDTAEPNGRHIDLNECEGVEERPSTTDETLATEPQPEELDIEDDPEPSATYESLAPAAQLEGAEIEVDQELSATGETLTTVQEQVGGVEDNPEPSGTGEPLLTSPEPEVTFHQHPSASGGILAIRRELQSSGSVLAYRRTNDPSSSCEELEWAASWTRMFRKCGRLHITSNLVLADRLRRAKRELPTYLWQKAVVDAGLTIDIANKHLQIEKNRKLFSQEIKPLLPNIDGYTTLYELAGCKPEKIDELIEKFNEKPFRITRDREKRLDIVAKWHDPPQSTDNSLSKFL